LFKPKPSEEIKKDREKWLQVMLEKSQALDRIIKAENTGWKEFSLLLNDYINKCKKRKALTALDRATEDEIFQLKLLDHEIYILSWVLKIPEQFIGKIEKEIKDYNKESEA
jgi:hypothetical protein